LTVCVCGAVETLVAPVALFEADEAARKLDPLASVPSPVTGVQFEAPQLLFSLNV
jgi:hypothetical protein